MIERLPYLAAIFAGSAIAAIPASSGISYLTTAAGGVVGMFLTLAIYGAYFAGKKAAIKQLGGAL